MLRFSFFTFSHTRLRLLDAAIQIVITILLRHYIIRHSSSISLAMIISPCLLLHAITTPFLSSLLHAISAIERARYRHADVSFTRWLRLLPYYYISPRRDDYHADYAYFFHFDDYFSFSQEIFLLRFHCVRAIFASASFRDFHSTPFHYLFHYCWCRLMAPPSLPLSLFLRRYHARRHTLFEDIRYLLHFFHFISATFFSFFTFLSWDYLSPPLSMTSLSFFIFTPSISRRYFLSPLFRFQRVFIFIFPSLRWLFAEYSRLLHSVFVRAWCKERMRLLFPPPPSRHFLPRYFAPGSCYAITAYACARYSASVSGACARAHILHIFLRRPFIFYLPSFYSTPSMRRLFFHYFTPFFIPMPCRFVAYYYSLFFPILLMIFHASDAMMTWWFFTDVFSRDDIFTTMLSLFFIRCHDATFAADTRLRFFIDAVLRRCRPSDFARCYVATARPPDACRTCADAAMSRLCARCWCATRRWLCRRFLFWYYAADDISTLSISIRHYDAVALHDDSFFFLTMLDISPLRWCHLMSSIDAPLRCFLWWSLPFIYFSFISLFSIDVYSSYLSLIFATPSLSFTFCWFLMPSILPTLLYTPASMFAAFIVLRLTPILWFDRSSSIIRHCCPPDSPWFPPDSSFWGGALCGARSIALFRRTVYAAAQWAICCWVQVADARRRKASARQRQAAFWARIAFMAALRQKRAYVSVAARGVVCALARKARW